MIDPHYWLSAWKTGARAAQDRAARRHYRKSGLSVTPWFDGTSAPARPGYYDRMYTDGLFRHYWDGKGWRSDPRAYRHWRQRGDYPCWRGLVAPSEEMKP